jgi:hypothetical protein
MWFAWGSENVFLICHTKKSPEAETWSAACRAVAEGLRRSQGRRIGTLVLTDSGGPSTTQREELAQATERKKYPVSVVSSSPAVRFIASSMALFIPEMQSFLPADWRKALDHLGMEPMERKTLERALRDLAARPNADRFAVLKSVASSIP